MKNSTLLRDSLSELSLNERFSNINSSSASSASTPESTPSKFEGYDESPCSETYVSYMRKDKEADYWKNQFFEAIKQNQILQVRENYYTGRIELLETHLTIQQRNSDLNDLLVSEMLDLYHKLEEWQAYSKNLEDIVREMQLENSDGCDEEKFLLQLYKFFKRSNFDGDEEEFERLIKNGLVHFYILNDNHSVMLSSTLICENDDFRIESILQETSNISNTTCEKCLSESYVNNVQNAQNNNEDDNLKTVITKKKKDKKKLSSVFWRYLRCTLAPKR